MYELYCMNFFNNHLQKLFTKVRGVFFGNFGINQNKMTIYPPTRNPRTLFLPYQKSSAWFCVGGDIFGSFQNFRKTTHTPNFRV